jgi:VWFA-related protein
MIMRTLRIVAVLSLLALAAVAQMRETVNVNVIEVPVTVVDSSGNPIRGLTAANFELLDQGKRREITSFDKIDFAASEVSSAISPLNPAARRSFLLLFDLGFSSPKSLQRAQEAARKFVTDNVQPRDLVGVGTIDVDKGFRLLSAFTTDRELIASAIADPGAFRGTDPLQIANQSGTADASALKEAPGAAASAGGGLGAESRTIAAAELAETRERMGSRNQQYVRQRVEKHVDALGQLARTLRAVPGRKQVILLSEGFDASVLQGRDARETTAQAKENDSVLRGELWNVDNDARYGSTSSMTILDRMTQYFRQSDVVLHAMDIQGVRVQNDVQSGAQMNSNAGLFVVARPTGGSVFQNANDLKTNFTRMLHEQEVVYVLGFQAPTVKPGTFHDLKVKLVNVPGGARISARAGYFEAGGETPAERSLSNAEIVVNDIPQNDVHVAALAAAFPTGSANAQVPIILELNGADLAREAKNGVAGAEIYVYAFDKDGVVRDRLYQKLTLDMKKVGDRLKATGVRYYGTLVLPPGQYAIKSLVRAGDGEKRGFARVNVTVARPNELAVSPPIPIDEQPKWLLVKPPGSHAAASMAYPFEVDGQDFIPSVSARGGQKLALFVYGAKPEDITWQTTPKTKLVGQASANGAMKMVVQLDDTGGATQLDVKVQKKGSPDSQQSSVAVEH